MTTHSTAHPRHAFLPASAESTQDAALFNNLHRAHENAGGLGLAYQAAVHGAATTTNPTPTMAALNALFLDQYARAEPHVRRAFVADVLTGDMGVDLPFAINGVPFSIDVPDADEALASVVTGIDWHTLEDEDEAEDQAVDVAQAVLKAGYRLLRYGLADEATMETYTARARRLPNVATLIGLDDVALPGNARTVARRLLEDIQARRKPDALTEGLMLALLRWIDDRVLETMAGADVLSLREGAGLTQQALADQIGITRERLMRLEAGKDSVSARLSRAIVDACRTTTATGRPASAEPTVRAG